MIARLLPGATREQAQAQVDALNAGNLERAPEMKTVLINAGFHTRVVGLKEEVVRDIGGTLFLLWGGALFVLPDRGVNVANLSLARSGARLRELATRLALGATRRHVARQLFAESLLLTVAAAVLGLLLGYGRSAPSRPSGSTACRARTRLPWAARSWPSSSCCRSWSGSGWGPSPRSTRSMPTPPPFSAAKGAREAAGRRPGSGARDSWRPSSPSRSSC